MGDIEITEDSFLEMSKFTIIPSGLKCEQSGNSRECGVVLSCWHAFSHHLANTHSNTVTAGARKRGKQADRARREHTYRCKASRCNAASQTFRSKSDLHEHVKNSHMVHTRALQCPIRNCKHQPVARPTMLREHFQAEHSALTGQRHERNSDLFAPSWIPTSRLTMPEPPPLPPSLELGTVLVSVTPSVRPATLSQSSQSTALRSPQKQQLKRPAPTVEPEPSSEIELELDELPPLNIEDGVPIGDVFVWQRPEYLQKNVGPPQTALAPTEIRTAPLPISMYFDVLKLKVEPEVAKKSNKAGSSKTK